MIDNDLAYVMRAVSSRMKLVGPVKEQIPRLEILIDRSGNAMQSFLEALSVIGDRPVILLEDDIKLTSQFCEKAEKAVGNFPKSVIKFFDLSKKQTQSRWESGAKFCSTLCIYLPANYATQITDFYPAWERKEIHPTGTDILIADWLKSRKERYYVYCPSLVQHLPVVSVINSRRSKYRQSITFVE